MKQSKYKHSFAHDISAVFSRFTNAVLLDLNQKSVTFNTSYTQPIGTKFKYVEHSFGQDVEYTATITKHEKPYCFEYSLVNKQSKITISWLFETADNNTVVSLLIILENDSFFQRFMKRNLIKAQTEAFKKYITYCEKTL
ncbi:MAG: DUF3284 domain-containing protein [Culicoidibacterales bacterium]